ncbi:hypothetical protein EON65_29465 [archaeon]|nr:MAG: hypothetical protein EON65_29465 [archaeon]
MEFLASNYGTDSESEEEGGFESKETNKPPQVAPAAASSVLVGERASRIENLNTATPKFEAPKRVRKLDISFLPQDIQDALLKGSSANDSDEDDNWQPQLKVQKKSESKPVTEISSSSSSKLVNPLLQMLPPPKQSKKQADDPFVAVMRDRAQQSSSQIDKKSTTKSDKPDIHDFYTNNTKNASSLSSSSAFQSQSVADVFSAPEIPRDYSAIALPSVPSVTLLPVSSVYAEYGARPQPAGYDMTAYHTQQEAETGIDANKNKKKRERDLEAHLMAGDMSVLGEAKVAHIQGFNSWDSRAYMDQQAREASIIKQYTGPDSNKSLVQANKVQNRKHQLTSLAMKAAETELALLDARGARMKTKSQTQSKYGW